LADLAGSLLITFSVTFVAAFAGGAAFFSDDFYATAVCALAILEVA